MVFLPKEWIMINDDVLLLAKKIKAVADTGLVYCTDDYNVERYTQLQEMALELMAAVTGNEIDVVTNIFDKVQDYPTPKTDVRAWIMNERKELLLVQEKSDGKWTLPGGWAEIGLTPAESILKEVKEETGLDAVVTRLLAVFDKKKYAHPPQPFYVYKYILLCEIMGEYNFVKPFDIQDIRFFPIDQLPELSEHRILPEQLQLVHKRIQEGNMAAFID